MLSGCGGSLDNNVTANALTGAKPVVETSLSKTSATDPALAKVAAAARPATAPAAATGAISDPTQLARAADKFMAGATPGNTGYKIGQQDILDISVFKVSDLNRTVQVSESGTINYPLIGDVPAAGRTPTEMEQFLTAKLGAKYLQSPQVTVTVKEYNSQRVTVEGAVKKPGVYPLRAKTTLLQMVAITDGLTEVAESDLVLFRQTNGKRTATRYDVDELRAGRIEDPVLLAGDVIVANASGAKTAFQNVLKALPLASVVRLF